MLASVISRCDTAEVMPEDFQEKPAVIFHFNDPSQLERPVEEREQMPPLNAAAQKVIAADRAVSEAAATLSEAQRLSAFQIAVNAIDAFLDDTLRSTHLVAVSVRHPELTVELRH